MKKKLYSILMLALASAFVSCEQDVKLNPSNNFSDVSFVNSLGQMGKFQSRGVVVGDYISFMDMSQNPVTHEWVIPDSCRFLPGDIPALDLEEGDETYIDYVVSDNLVSNDSTVHVVYMKPGREVTVTLNNSFKDAVSITFFNQEKYYDAEDEYIETFSVYNEKTGLYDFTYDFTYTVYDDVVADYKIYKVGELGDTIEIAAVTRYDEIVPEEERDTVKLEVGETIFFEVDSLYGMPTKALFSVPEQKGLTVTSLAGATEESDVAFNIPNPKASLYIGATGEFDPGVLSIVRQSPTTEWRPIPAATAEFELPIIIEGVPPTKPYKVIAHTLVRPEPMTRDYKVSQLTLGAQVGEIKGDLKSAFDVKVFTLTDRTTDADTMKVYDTTFHPVNIVDAVLNPDSLSMTFTYDNSIYSDDKTIFTVKDSTIVTDVFGRPLIGFEPAAWLRNFAVYSLFGGNIGGFELALSTDGNKAPSGWYGNPSYVSGTGFTYGTLLPSLPNMALGGVGTQTLIIDTPAGGVTTDQKYGTSTTKMNGPDGPYVVNFSMYQPTGTEFTGAGSLSFIISGKDQVGGPVWGRVQYPNLAHITGSAKDQWIRYSMPITLFAKGVVDGNVIVCVNANSLLQGPLYYDRMSIDYDTRRVVTVVPEPVETVVVAQ